VSGFGDLLSRLEPLGRAESLDPDARGLVFELLDAVDTVHRVALHRLGDLLGASPDGLRAADPAVAWLFEAYAVGLDERAAADEVVSLRMSGTCSGCTASAVTLREPIDLRESIDGALRDDLPGFVRTEVEDDGAEPHPPPVGPVPVQLRPRGR